MDRNAGMIIVVLGILVHHSSDYYTRKDIIGVYVNESVTTFYHTDNSCGTMYGKRYLPRVYNNCLSLLLSDETRSTCLLDHTMSLSTCRFVSSIFR